MHRSGAQLFARYAYPPNELGYCGPPDASVLLRRGPSADAAIAQHARRFEGAWAYLDLLASAAGIADPLDARVVEAYWLGNDLLELVPDTAVAGELQARLPPQPGACWSAGAAHHGYQVFSVYPWLGLLAKRRGAPDAALNILQQCRIRWGEVVEVTDRQARVRCAPLRLTGERLELATPVEQTAALIAGDADDTDRTPQAGDTVALHWDWVCDVLSPAQAAMLRTHTEAQLARANAAMAAG